MRACINSFLFAHYIQGSETETVIYVVGNSRGQTWQHVYTAVTRGRKRVILITRQSELLAAIGREPLRRQTSLFHRVLDELYPLSTQRERTVVIRNYIYFHIAVQIHVFFYKQI